MRIVPLFQPSALNRSNHGLFNAFLNLIKLRFCLFWKKKGYTGMGAAFSDSSLATVKHLYIWIYFHYPTWSLKYLGPLELNCQNGIPEIYWNILKHHRGIPDFMFFYTTVGGSSVHIFTSSHLHICTHLLSLSLFFTSSHLHIFSLSLSLSLPLSCPLSRSLSFFFFSLLGRLGREFPKYHSASQSIKRLDPQKTNFSQNPKSIQIIRHFGFLDGVPFQDNCFTKNIT